ncbi:hypothetical protein [Streptomyces demainii]|uniref:Aminoglycoside phosphotransferase family protein n=1 Tax=Streptomyces demainii TaxID=588122 RepID=A0ABT9L6V4_9ACTN|nr:hypothetical protein [Streptomyces demainii]MDP9612945.1 hypothetical protein [Streptomyces demainii]MDP9616363.1 hypothetical protein [Streptomyces demainii]MDP9616450.1 hypothetical protein [Streptomyces demainii]
MPASYSLVPSPDGDALLLVAMGDAWGLPAHPCSSAGDVNRRIREAFGIDVTVATSFGEVLDGHSHVYLLAHQNHGTGGELPRSARWVERKELETLLFVDPEQRKLAEEWFAMGAGHDQAALSPAAWAGEDWFAEASAWMTEAAARASLSVTGPVEQFMCSPYSVTMRIPTSAGFAYFKAAPPEFAYEPVLVSAVAEWFPQHTPRVLEIDQDRAWLLTLGLEPFHQIEPTLQHVELYERMVRVYARMQRETAGKVETLLAMGVPDRRPDTLPSLLEELLQDEVSLLYAGDGALTRDEHARLLDFVPVFREQCARLAGFHLPDTLQNVDFWRDNIAVTTDGFVFLDWAESVISSPIHSMNMVLRDFVIHDVRDKEELHRRLFEAYFSEWADHEPMERLQEAYQLSQSGSVLCRALSWRDSTASLGEPRRHAYLRPAVAANTRRLLEFADIS